MHIKKSGLLDESESVAETERGNTRSIKDDSSFGLPKFEVALDSLPSKGVLYPEGTKIHYLPYTFGELLRHSASDVDTKDDIHIVAKGIQPTGIEVKDLTYWDFVFIGILRNMTRGDVEWVGLSYNCPRCEQRVNTSVLFTDIEFTDLDIPKFPVVVNLKDVNWEFYPLTMDKYVKLIEGEHNTDSRYVFAAQVTNRPLDNTLALFDSAIDEDAEVLEYIDGLLFHGPNPVTVTCNHCTKQVPIDITDKEVFIRPFRRSEFSPRDRITFGQE